MQIIYLFFVKFLLLGHNIEILATKGTVFKCEYAKPGTKIRIYHLSFFLVGFFVCLFPPQWTGILFFNNDEDLFDHLLQIISQMQATSAAQLLKRA